MASENESILAELECLVCKEYMYPPIKQCTAGHSMCEICFGKVTTCPTCRAALGTSRNFSLESIHSKVQVPCKYNASGCPVLEVGATIKIHQEFCEYGERPCPLKDSANCPWIGKPKDLVEHAKENHEQHPQVTEDCDIRIKGFLTKLGPGKHYRLVHVHCNMFKYCINMNYALGIIQWSVQFVGPREDATKYSYVLKFMDKNKGKNKYIVVSTCQPLTDDGKIFDFANSSTIYFDQLKQFCNDDNCLYFHFKIMLTKDLDTVLPKVARIETAASTSSSSFEEGEFL